MVEHKPVNLFSSSTFISLIIVVLSAAQPSILDISKNGGSFDKYFNLIITFFGAIGVAADKVDKEKNVYTPNWFPVGRNSDEVVAKIEESVPVKEVALKVATSVEETTSKVNEMVNKVESAALKSPLDVMKVL